MQVSAAEMDVVMSTNLTWTFEVDESAERAFEAVNNVRGWWSGGITGTTDELGGEFSYWVPGTHYTKFRVTELEPNRRVAWTVLDSWLGFPADTAEWDGTTVTFDIDEVGGRTQLRFTHHGLSPEAECYDVCSIAWGGYVMHSLRDLIASGVGRPNSIESAEAVEELRPTLTAQV
jgi:uncharacterized protein YndB with AHSA1/START domain